MIDIKWRLVSTPTDPDFHEYFCGICRCCGDPDCHCRSWKAKEFYDIEGLSEEEKEDLYDELLDGGEFDPTLCQRCVVSHGDEIIRKVREKLNEIRG